MVRKILKNLSHPIRFATRTNCYLFWAAEIAKNAGTEEERSARGIQTLENGYERNKIQVSISNIEFSYWNI